MPDDPAGATGRHPAGRLEASVLAVLQAATAALTPGQVQQHLAAGKYGKLSYSTVATILTRLRAKGLLARERSGSAFAYSAVDEASVAQGG